MYIQDLVSGSMAGLDYYMALTNNTASLYKQTANDCISIKANIMRNIIQVWNKMLFPVYTLYCII